MILDKCASNSTLNMHAETSYTLTGYGIQQNGNFYKSI